MREKWDEVLKVWDEYVKKKNMEPDYSFFAFLDSSRINEKLEIEDMDQIIYALNIEIEYADDE